MVDPDAPRHTNQQAWLHWIRAGLTGKDLLDGTMNSGQDIMAYTPPTPPPHTGIHRYFVFVFEGAAQGRLRRSTHEPSSTSRSTPRVTTCADLSPPTCSARSIKTP
ncbi:Phosphatidylethanolamine-binding protein 4 [Chionoecetes opilio]|uniref:Phosphatidylethanolamine-binding protein 4 n=1 Tax=Chionoecetes opilio TaxID=41210 RepID=A0A8J4XMR7_CHIOP|nr:Phosphatidylethanolamine-binding protein 4 [Chionoecetes opilio]